MADAGGVTLNKIQIGAFAPCPLLSNVDGNYTPLLDILDTMQTSIDECCEAEVRFVTRCIDAITDNATYQHSNINLARI